ncbi:MAG: lipoprotein [Spiroplasma phoeniceum]|nr:MAG: lipoprotein [Spiroplasma phoeniceum]UZQ31868.1 MAG: lipoprotein [Spiroplasma phoeniceum]
MKKILSILGAIGLTATSTTSLVACDNNKSAEKPPENSKWKLVSSILGEGNTKKW